VRLVHSVTLLESKIALIQILWIEINLKSPKINIKSPITDEAAGARAQPATIWKPKKIGNRTSRTLASSAVPQSHPALTLSPYPLRRTFDPFSLPGNLIRLPAYETLDGAPELGICSVCAGVF
jgi:hypothetical protein